MKPLVPIVVEPLHFVLGVRPSVEHPVFELDNRAFRIPELSILQRTIVAVFGDRNMEIQGSVW